MTAPTATRCGPPIVVSHASESFDAWCPTCEWRSPKVADRRTAKQAAGAHVEGEVPGQ